MCCVSTSHVRLKSVFRAGSLCVFVCVCACVCVCMCECVCKREREIDDNLDKFVDGDDPVSQAAGFS